MKYYISLTMAYEQGGDSIPGPFWFGFSSGHIPNISVVKGRNPPSYRGVHTCGSLNEARAWAASLISTPNLALRVDNDQNLRLYVVGVEMIKTSAYM